MRRIPIHFDLDCLRNQRKQALLYLSAKTFLKRKLDLVTCNLVTLLSSKTSLVWFWYNFIEIASLLRWSIGKHKLRSLFKVAMTTSIWQDKMLQSHKSLLYENSKQLFVAVGKGKKLLKLYWNSSNLCLVSTNIVSNTQKGRETLIRCRIFMFYHQRATLQSSDSQKHSVSLWFSDFTRGLILASFSINASFSCQNVNKTVKAPSNGFYNAH